MGAGPMVTIAVSRVELDHVLTVLRDARRDGSYYGNREQYYSRHDRIFARLAQSYCDLTRSDGYRLKPTAGK